MFMSVKNGIEAITGEKVNILDLHEFIKRNNYIFPGTDNLLSDVLMATIMTAYTNNRYTVQYMTEFEEYITIDKKKTRVQPTIETFNTIESPDEKYIIHLRIKDPDNNQAIVHSVMVTDIVYTKDKQGRITDIDNVNVANSLLPSGHINTRTNYLPNEIIRWDIFKVTDNR